MKLNNCISLRKELKHMELVKGRPSDETNRLQKEIDTYDFLDSLCVAYDRIDHEAAFTMEVCEEIDKVLGGKTCKNLFLCNRQKTAFYLLLMPGDKPFKTKESYQRQKQSKTKLQNPKKVLLETETMTFYRRFTAVSNNVWIV